MTSLVPAASDVVAFVGAVLVLVLGTDGTSVVKVSPFTRDVITSCVVISTLSTSVECAEVVEASALGVVTSLSGVVFARTTPSAVVAEVVVVVVLVGDAAVTTKGVVVCLTRGGQLRSHTALAAGTQSCRLASKYSASPHCRNT